MKLVPVLSLLAVLFLAGCGDTYDPIAEGIRCSDAGGVWSHSDWSGYSCEFGVEK